MEIRQCREADVARVGEFYDGIVQWLNCHINYPKWIYRVYPSEGFAREMVEAGSLHLCEGDGKILGAFALDADPLGEYLGVGWKRNLPSGLYMALHALAIDPSSQRRGLASEVIRFCVKTATSKGSKALRVDIVPSNRPARRLFEESGFIYAGEADLGRGIDDIPVFCLYELNW